MNTINLGEYYDFERKNKIKGIDKKMFENGPIFVIGVKEFSVKDPYNYNKLAHYNNRDLDQFMKAYNELEITHRFPDVCNIRYLTKDNQGHVLQPAFIDWKKST